MVANYTAARRISLRDSSQFNEDWLSRLIEDDPTILGLGDLRLKSFQRAQARGRLDLLLQDDESNRRYCVELQLGATDPSHIIRTLEYWDVERKRYPQYEHCAVIVAEEITARFLNVISLFNGSVPLIAIQVGAYEVGGSATLIFTKVLDEVSRGLVDEDEPVASRADRGFWEQKPQSQQFLKIVDTFFAAAKVIRPEIAVNYTRRYISPTFSGVVSNSFILLPRKAGAVVYFYCEQENLKDAWLEASPFENEAYNQSNKAYRVRLSVADAIERQADIEAMLSQFISRGGEEAS